MLIIYKGFYLLDIVSLVLWSLFQLWLFTLELSKINQFLWISRIWSSLPIVFSSHFLSYQTHCNQIKIPPRYCMMYRFIILWGLKINRRERDTKMQKTILEPISIEIIHCFWMKCWIFLFILLLDISHYMVFKSYPLGFTFDLYDVILAAIWVIFFCGAIIAD